MYDGSHAVRQDHAEAARWFRLAAERGHAIAQANLVRQFYMGQGVPEDYVRSYAWFALAAAQGERNSVMNKKNHCQSDDGRADRRSTATES